MSHGTGGHSLEDAARDACARAGLEYRSGIPQDGNWHRLNVINDRRGQDDGAIKLFPDGEGGIVWNWKTDYYEPFFRTRANPPTEAELAAQAKVRREAEQERERARVNARGRAKSLWEQGDPVGPAGHPYLTKKGVGDHGIRVIRGMRRGEGHDDTLVIPVWRAGELITVQLISTGGVKRFLKHSTPKGGHLILNHRDEGPGLIAEGFATSATLAEITRLMCVCAFSRGGLLATTQAMQEMFPGRQFIICGDYDRDGIKTAGLAAQQSGALLAIPDFSGAEAGKGDTDFNDLARLAGNGAVLEQIKAVMKAAPLAGGTSRADAALTGKGRHADHQGGDDGDGRDMTQAPPANKGESRGSNEKSALVITPGRIKWRSPENIPPRDFIYGDHYIRKYVSMTSAPGGTGKTALATVEALAMVTGRPLLGVKVPALRRVWYIGEDDREEIERRFVAAMKRYGINHFEVEGLMIDSFRDLPLIVYDGNEDITGPSAQTRAAIIAAALREDLDVIIADPSIKTHKGKENENRDMNAAIGAWVQVADGGRCAVELLSHSRKAIPGTVRSVDDIRGGSAQVDAARHARILVKMNEAEAASANIDEEEMFRYVRIGDTKSNMSPAHPSEWFRLDSVFLGNGLGDLIPSDSVQVISTFKPKAPLDDISMEEIDAVMREIDAGNYRHDARAENWVGDLIGEKFVIPDDKTGRKKIMRIISAWVKSGALEIEKRRDETRRERQYVKLGNWEFSR